MRSHFGREFHTRDESFNNHPLHMVLMDVIRKADIDDLEAIEDIAIESYSIYLKRMNKAPAPMLEDYKKLIQNQLVYVLENESIIIGFLVLIPKSEALVLDNIAIHPKYQSKGYGKKLMSFAEETGRTMGFNEIHLYTNVKMVENLGIYRHLGWVEYERRTDVGYDRVYLKKGL